MNSRSLFCLTSLLIILLPLRSATAESAEDRANAILEGFSQVQQDYQRFQEEIVNLIRVDFDLDSALLLPQEEVELRITAHCETSPNPKLELIEDCYSETPRTTSFDLKWNKTLEGEFVANWKWTPTGTGNYLLHWVCDIGGDIPVFYRNFSVIDDSFAVAILNSTSHRQPRPEPDFHELHLPFSYWAESMLFTPRGSAQQFANFSMGARQYGDDPGLMIFKGGCYLKDDQTVFYDEPEPVQRAVLASYQELWGMHGFPQPLSSLYTYGLGNGPVKVARSLGFDLLGALCADQNWGDGPFQINHWGMPARPYFVSSEDFRKPGPGNSGAMVGVQQCERYTVGCRDYNCVYSFEGGISYAFDQYTAQAKDRVVDEIILSREKDFLECLLNSAGQTDTPFFFSCGIEMNGVWPEMAEINRMMMEHLVKRSRDFPLAFANASETAKFMRRHYDKTPESILYLPDVYCGLTQGGKPACHPDTMEIENADLRAIFRFGEELPYAQYDYTASWNYPDWGNEEIPRKPDGYVIPNTEDRFRVTPKILDTRGIEVRTQTEERAEATVMTLEIDAASDYQNLALAVWNLPRTYTEDSNQFLLQGAERFIPVRAPFTGNLNGILIADLKKGKNQMTLEVKTDSRPLQFLDVRLGESAFAKVLDRGGESTAYLFTTAEVPVDLEIAPTSETEAQLFPSNYEGPIPLRGLNTIRLDPGQCPRVVGLSREELQKACPDRKTFKAWQVEDIPSISGRD
ncbi:MAG: hypothetical protein H6752_19325 [Candidatus Omnitrophica bacterium]|nr:hypothetical protein [Candidatus Omnitrophota bacterium]